MPAMAPGIAPTRRKLEIAVITGIETGKVPSGHIYWDQASVLAKRGVRE